MASNSYILFYIFIVSILIISIAARPDSDSDFDLDFDIYYSKSEHDSGSDSSSVEESSGRKKKCSFKHEFCSIGDRGYLVSPKFPRNYPSRADCTYDIRSPPGTQMTIDCEEFNLQSSCNCEQDRLSLLEWQDGETMKKEEKFCAQNKIYRVTRGNRLRASFITGQVNPSPLHPFRFNCTISVVKVKDKELKQKTDHAQTNESEMALGVGLDAARSTRSDYECACGKRNWNWDEDQMRIVGGSAALVSEFPWRCVLYAARLGAFCGCSVISNEWVLTAAHCTNAIEEGDTLFVDLGDHDLSTMQETNNTVVRVAEIIQNARYSPLTQDFDVSLLKLDTFVPYTENIQPICLPWHLKEELFENKPNAVVTASGWGSSISGGPNSHILQTVDLPLLPTEECRQFYGNAITDNMICTYADGKDSCQGDSGSSIDYYDEDKGRYYSIAVVSWGFGCGHAPGVNFKITSVLDWIQQTTRENFCRG